MKHRLGIVLALGMGLFSPSVFAQPPAQPDPNAPPPPPAAPPAQNPDAPPPPPPPGAPQPTPDAPPPLTLPPYLTGNTTTPLMPPPPPAPPPPPPQQPPPGATTTITPPGPGADAGVVKKKGDAYVRWRGSGVSWNHSFSTQSIGVGRDYISRNEEQYTQGVGATVNYFIFEPKLPDGKPRGYSLRVTTSVGADVELTDGNTKTKYETQLRDIPLAFVFGKSLYKSADEQTTVGLNLNGTFVFPTSLNSRSQGLYLTASPRALIGASLPLRGKDAPFLKSVFLGLGVQYSHRFSAAETATNSDLAVPRTSLTYAPFYSDQLSGRSLNNNNLRVSGFAFFSEELFGGYLWASVGGAMAYQFVHQFAQNQDVCVQTLTGCAAPTGLTNPLNTRVITEFGISLQYFPMAEWGIGLGYDNVTGQLGQDGKWRNPFYSPDATFGASVLLSVDAIYERLQGKPREEPVIYFGSNKKTRKVPQNQAHQPIFF